MRVGILGATGRMGLAIRGALEESAHDLVATPANGESPASFVEAQVQVVVDVTTTQAARANLPLVANQQMHAVVGTTGFDETDVENFDRLFREAGRTCLIVPNFSISAVLMMKFAAEAAPYFDNVEIIELHHERKRDAPSGTAALTAARIAEARNGAPFGDVVGDDDGLAARGAVVHGVHVHSIRSRGLLAHQEVILGSEGETLTIRQDSMSRSSFMSGVLRCIDRIDALEPGVVVGLEAVL